MRTALRRAVRVLSWVALLAVSAAAVVGVLVPRVAGARTYTILTASMEPTLPPGTLVVVRPVDATSVAVGDVVTYQLHSGHPQVVTHRVVGQGLTTQGSPVLRTKGDANAAPDSEPVRPVQVRGVLWYAVPHLGRVNQLLPGHSRQVATAAAVLGLSGYAVWNLVGAVRDRRRGRAA